MPYTLNGIGTTYYGKSNFSSTQGVCPHCNRETELQSYDTRLWFVVVFIPIIPLGKKRILDYCRKCTRHTVMPLEDYNKVTQSTIEEGRAAMNAKPDDPVAALDFYSMLIAFGDPSEIATFTEKIEKQFPKDASVQFNVGCHYSEKGDMERAGACFDRALRADPEHPGARRGAAVMCIQKGELSKARQLLSFMMQPGPLQDPSVLFLLADAYKTKGQPAESYAIFQVIIRDFPEIARKDKSFRKAVKAVENGVGNPGTILPKAARSYKLAVCVALVVLLAVGGFFLNGYLRDHRDLLIVNETDSKATVIIPGKNPIGVGAHKKMEITLPEGAYQVKTELDGGIVETVPVKIGGDRFSGGRLFVLNTGGGAVIMKEETLYSKNPSPKDKPRYTFYVGDRFLIFPRIDYPFKPFPETISVKGDRGVWKSRLEILKFRPAAMLGVLHDRVSPEKILAYAEMHLLTGKDSGDLAENYADICGDTDKVEKCFEFLEKGIDRRPLSVEWHRSYQGYHRMFADEQDLVDQYDQMLSEDPENSDLLYLRGRIEISGKKALDYYDRAINVNNANPYPLFAKAHYLAGCGRFADAKDLIQSACTLRQNDEKMADMLYDIRFALKEYGDLEKEAEASISKEPLNQKAFKRLLEARGAKGDTDGVLSALSVLEKNVKKNVRENSDQYIALGRLAAADTLNDMQKYLELAKKIKNPEYRTHCAYVAHLSLGNMAEAEKVMEKEEIDGFSALLFWLGWMNEGDTAKAESWMETAREKLSEQTREEQIIADLLVQPDEDIAGRMEDLTVSIPAKRIIYTALARKYPKQKSRLIAMAERLNADLSFPHHFLASTIRKIKEE